LDEEWRKKKRRNLLTCHFVVVLIAILVVLVVVLRKKKIQPCCNHLDKIFFWSKNFHKHTPEEKERVSE
jgi:hypothetical protein